MQLHCKNSKSGAIQMTQSTPNPSQSFEELLQQLPIIHQFGCPALERSDGGMMDYTCSCGNDRQAAKVITQAVEQLVEGIIGEDTPKNDPYDDPEAVGYFNILRGRQRAALLKALGGEDEISQ